MLFWDFFVGTNITKRRSRLIHTNSKSTIDFITARIQDIFLSQLQIFLFLNNNVNPCQTSNSYNHKNQMEELHLLIKNICIMLKWLKGKVIMLFFSHIKIIRVLLSKITSSPHVIMVRNSHVDIFYFLTVKNKKRSENINVQIVIRNFYSTCYYPNTLLSKYYYYTCICGSESFCCWTE